MRSIELRSPTDFDGFRAAARDLIAARIPPEHVRFRTRLETQSLFADGCASLHDAATGGGATINVPRAFIELARTVSLHEDPARFDLLYRLLWRLRAEPRLLTLDVDEDVAVARAWQKAVDRDIHKMMPTCVFASSKASSPAPSSRGSSRRITSSKWPRRFSSAAFPMFTGRS